MNETAGDSPAHGGPRRLPWAAWLFLAGFGLQQRLRRTVVLVHAVLKSVYVGLWLGVLGRRQMWAIDEFYYSREPRYRDREHNLAGLMPWEKRAISEHFGDCRRLLVTAAGGGREVLALHELGFEVVAEECNPELVELANALAAERGCPSGVRQGPRDGCGLVGQAQVDGVVVGWGAFTHLQDRWRRVAYLQQLRSLITDGGPLLLSFFARPERPRMMRIVRAASALGRGLRGRPPVELGDVLDPHFQHYFSRREIAEELAAAGFTLVAYSTEEYAHAVARAS